MEVGGMLKCPDCGVRFYESTAYCVYSGEKVIICPKCGSRGPFDKIELKDVMI
jgi:uncharacterized OB-fold protein